MYLTKLVLALPVVPYPKDHITVLASIKDMAFIQKVFFEYSHYGVFYPKTFLRI